MDEKLARHVVRIAFNAAARLNDLLPLMQPHVTDDEFKTYRTLICSIAARIHLELLNKIFTDFPQLETEMKESIEKYGELI